MIQRVQSLFLLAVAVLSALLLAGNLMEMKDVFGNIYMMDFKTVTVSIGGKTQVQNILPVAIIFVAVPLFALVSIFLYKNRRLQMRMTLLTLLLSAGSVFIAAFFIIMLGKKIEGTFIWNYKAVFPAVNIILCWLAYRAIKKDDEKVRSLDRLR